MASHLQCITEFRMDHNMSKTLSRIVLTGICCICLTSMQAQFRAGIKGGVNFFDVSAPALSLVDEGGVAAYSLGIDKTKIGVHIGFFFQGEFGPVFVQPEVVFNSQGVDYRITDLQDPGMMSERRDETYQTLDFPLILGLKFGPVRIGGGPVGHLFLNSNSDLDDFFGDAYSASFNTLEWGWQAGLGFDFWKLHIDGRYEGNFNNFGNHMSFYGNDYEFDDTASRIVISIGISF